MKKLLCLLTLILLGCNVPNDTVEGNGVVIQTKHRQDKHYYNVKFENGWKIRFIYDTPQHIHVGDTIKIHKY